MKISRIECDYLVLSLEIPVRGGFRDYGVLLVSVTTDEGIVGTGFARAYDFHGVSVAHTIREELAPFVMERDFGAPGEMWHEAGFDMPFGDWRRPNGVVNSAIGTVDQALWDAWGQKLGEPVYRLLGGSQTEIPLYATFGLNIYTPEEEMEAARLVKAKGFTAFKLQGVDDRGGKLDAAVGRIERLRETVGDDCEIILDAHGNYDLLEAGALLRALRPYRVAYVDEPLRSRDPFLYRKLREECPDVPVAARSRAGSFADGRDLILSGGLSVMGSNVMDQGGYTQTIKVAHLAEAHGLRMVTGGAFHLHNSHLIAAATNGWWSEYHTFAAALSETIFADVIRPHEGVLTMGDRPGLGLTPNPDAVAEAKARAAAATR
jgi:L-alanine-DL-glutamate epimerase-like enolase superfamily enzyme